MKSHSTWFARLILICTAAAFAACAPIIPSTPANPAPAPEQTGATPSTAEPQSEATQTPGASESASANALIGTTWQLTAIVGNDGAMLPAVPGAAATANFQNGVFGGNDGCNDLFGTYSLDGASLTITVTGGTLMACQSAAINEQGRLYLDNLGRVASYRLQDGTLTLSDASGNAIATFTDTAAVGEGSAPSATPTAPGVSTQQALTSVLWQWTGTQFEDGTGLGIKNPQRYTISLSPGGALAIFADCNQGSGAYTLSGDGLQVTLGAFTLMACGASSMDQIFLAQLATAQSFAVNVGELSIQLSDGSATMKFVAAS